MCVAMGRANNVFSLDLHEFYEYIKTETAIDQVEKKG